ncbi:plant basic secretory protein [Eremomyces bilateralis CBS 781.70]|uniref:Plant basic secretory protein n=1 Tax=Eremomyces bilateralis CBS 781.70 TaxID=1392243 RepID=A0A6G1G1G8_9PEZI|nr:plant basic secretory protein [Eremomyces bilateralis CBS 781.70]KAF1811649.1 plant basic secretory protein [Eremomyces bilateralis CBS 781.70]
MPSPIYYQIPSTTLPPPSPPIHPLLRLELRDLSSPGAQRFLSTPNCGTLLSTCVSSVISHLYTRTCAVPPTRSVTLILRSMPGVAYTTGTDLDADHKEIHFSTDYIAGISEARIEAEICGVVCHEMVHCFQWDARGTAPGGLIEGVADWVRLRCRYVPPHWKREADGEWDAGYQHTGYFLEYLEGRFGEGSVRRVNEKLKGEDYEEERFWEGLFGEGVGRLWEEYGKSMTEESGKDCKERA